MPRPRRSRRSTRRLSTWARTETSSAEVGSSATISSGSRARARAMATRWRCPPESCPGRAARVWPGRPTRSSSSSTRASRASRVPRRWTSSGSRRIWRTVRRGLRAVEGSWKTTPTAEPKSLRRSAPVISHRSRPWKRTWPSVGFWSPVRTRARVDLPQPDSPTRPTISPRLTSRVASVSAWTASRLKRPPLRALWRTWTPSSLITGRSLPAVRRLRPGGGRRSRGPSWCRAR